LGPAGCFKQADEIPLRRRGESLERLHESHRKRATERELYVWM
jgi:hypothetical protein